VVQAIERFLRLPPHYTSATFRNWHLNRGDRRNSRLVSWVASREALIDVLGRLLPAAWLRAAARSFYGQAPARPGLAATTLDTQGTALDRLFREDRAYVRALFASGHVVDGAGQVLEPADAGQPTSTVMPAASLG
jgi:hypothetical protein